MFWWASELKCKATPDPIVEKAQPIPCDKITEGVATLRQDNDEYMKNVGLVLFLRLLIF